MGEQPDSTSSRFYVLEQLQDTAQTIELIIDVLPVYRERVAQLLLVDKGKAKDTFDVLASERSILAHHLHNLRPLLAELDETALAAGAETLSTQLAAFNLLTPDYGKLTAVLKAFAAQLPTAQKTNAAIIGRLMNSVRMGHYPTDLQNVAHLTAGIAFPPGVTTNLFDPCCGTGAALRKLATGNNCYAFGIELDESRAEQAQDQLHRVGFGSFFHARISHEVFHAIFLNPPYLSVLNENGGRSRDEKRFLIESIPHLMFGGLMLYIVPYYRMTEDLCRIFCDNFSDISAYRFTDGEFKKFKQIAVLGLRCKRRNGESEADTLAALADHPMELPCVTELTPGRYALPAEPRKVELFKGAEFNVAELARQLKSSDSFDRFFAKSKRDAAPKRPPLPLSIGQVGLIGGSGLINGLMDCDYPHIIKGRIVKVKNVRSEENLGYGGQLVSTEIRETLSNKMIFNILTPNGFRSLA